MVVDKQILRQRYGILRYDANTDKKNCLPMQSFSLFRHYIRKMYYICWHNKVRRK